MKPSDSIWGEFLNTFERKKKVDEWMVQYPLFLNMMAQQYNNDITP